MNSWSVMLLCSLDVGIWCLPGIASRQRGNGPPVTPYTGAVSYGVTRERAPGYALYRSRFLWRCALMRLRRLCFAIFAFRLFLSEPIQISRSLRIAIQPSNRLHCNLVSSASVRQQSYSSTATGLCLLQGSE